MALNIGELFGRDATRLLTTGGATEQQSLLQVGVQARMEALPVSSGRNDYDA